MHVQNQVVVSINFMDAGLLMAGEVEQNDGTGLLNVPGIRGMHVKMN